MANKIEIVIEASDKASTHIKALGGTLNASGTAAAFAATAYDKTAATANRLGLVTLQLAQAQKVLASETDPMKQAALRVEIDNLAKAQDQLQRETQESTTKLVQMGEAHGGIKVLGLSLTDLKSGLSLVMGAAQKAGQALQAAFDFTQQGAAIIQTTESFERLGLSIESLREASLGTVDDMTLMKASLTLTAGASEELQARLLSSAPQLLEIAKAANALNPTLGDTAFMYESIATGVKRASPMILDNLGIVVKIDEANRAYAATLGKTVDQLTAEEKQIALLNGTIAAGDRLIQQAGGTVEAFGDSWARLQVEIKNSTDEMKTASAIILGPVMGSLADFIESSRDADLRLGGLGASMRGLATWMGTTADQAKILGIVFSLMEGNSADAYAAIQSLRKEVEVYSDKLEHASGTTKSFSRDTKELTEELINERRILQSMQNELETDRELTSRISDTQARLGAELLSSSEAWDMYSQAIAGSEQATADYYAEVNKARDIARAQAAGEANVAAVHSDLTEKLEEGSEALSDLYDERSDILRQIQELEASNGRAVITQARSNLTENEAVLVTLQLADAQAKLAAETDPMKVAQLAVKIEGLQEKLSGATTATTTFIDNTKKIEELQGQYAALGEEIDGVTASIKETIDSFIIQQLESRLAIDGWNEAENELFLTLAQGLGVFDEQHAALAASIFDIAASVDGVGESTDQAWANAIAGAAQLLGMSEEVVAKYVDMAVQAGEVADATTAIATASDGVHEQVSSLGKGGSADLSDLVTEAETQAENIAAIGEAAETSHGQVTSLGKDGATDLGDLVPAADTAIERLSLLGEEGGESLGILEGAGRDAALGLDAVGAAALDAQAKIDAMHGKELFIDVYIREHGTNPANTQNPPGSGHPFQAAGGDYYVNRATHFVAGEAGAERAIFIPRGQPGYDAESTLAAIAAATAGAAQSYNQSRNVTLINPIFQGSQVATVRALAQMEF